MQASEETIRALRQMMAKWGYIDIPSNGVSMYPLIRTGNIGRFAPLVELRSGDILLFTTDMGTLVGHRYLRSMQIRGKTVHICKGDSNRAPDPPVDPEQVLGKLVSLRKSADPIPVERWWFRGWGWVIVRFPMLSACIHLYLRIHRKVRGMRRRSWVS
jgi:signal peptidase I